MQSKGLMIFITGTILLLLTLIWIYVDKKNKDKKEEKILQKATTVNTYVNSSSIKSEDDSAELLKDNTELLDETELLETDTKLLDITEVI